MKSVKNLHRTQWVLHVKEKWMNFIEPLLSTECAKWVIDKWKALFRNRWETCFKCDGPIYYGELYGSAEVYQKDSELSLIKGKAQFRKLLFCESCTKTGFYVWDGKQEYNITEKRKGKK